MLTSFPRSSVLQSSRSKLVGQIDGEIERLWGGEPVAFWTTQGSVRARGTAEELPVPSVAKLIEGGCGRRAGDLALPGAAKEDRRMRPMQQLGFAEGLGGRLVPAVSGPGGRAWQPRDGRRVA